jgi:hypothetical protein
MALLLSQLIHRRAWLLVERREGLLHLEHENPEVIFLVYPPSVNDVRRLRDRFELGDPNIDRPLDFFEKRAICELKTVYLFL